MIIGLFIGLVMAFDTIVGISNVPTGTLNKIKLKKKARNYGVGVYCGLLHQSKHVYQNSKETKAHPFNGGHFVFLDEKICIFTINAKCLGASGVVSNFKNIEDVKDGLRNCISKSDGVLSDGFEEIINNSDLLRVDLCHNVLLKDKNKSLSGFKSFLYQKGRPTKKVYNTSVGFYGKSYRSIIYDKKEELETKNPIIFSNLEDFQKRELTNSLKIEFSLKNRKKVRESYLKVHKISSVGKTLFYPGSYGVSVKDIFDSRFIKKTTMENLNKLKIVGVPQDWKQTTGWKDAVVKDREGKITLNKIISDLGAYEFVSSKFKEDWNQIREFLKMTEGKNSSRVLAQLREKSNRHKSRLNEEERSPHQYFFEFKNQVIAQLLNNNIKS